MVRCKTLVRAPRGGRGNSRRPNNLSTSESVVFAWFWPGAVGQLGGRPTENGRNLLVSIEKRHARFQCDSHALQNNPCHPHPTQQPRVHKLSCALLHGLLEAGVPKTWSWSSQPTVCIASRSTKLTFTSHVAELSTQRLLDLGSSYLTSWSQLRSWPSDVGRISRRISARAR